MDKANYTGRIEDLVMKAQEMQEEVISIKKDFLADKNYIPANEDEQQSRNMVVYLLEKLHHALDTVAEANIDFNIT